MLSYMNNTQKINVKKRHMAQYIEKSTLVAEIERRLLLLAPKMAFHQQREELKKLLSFINTLEVKEVNLEKEAELIANGIMIGVQANKYHTNVYNTKRNDFNHSHLMLAARKGIELGLKAQKGE